MNEYGFPILAHFILPFGPVITLWVENMSLHKIETKNMLNKSYFLLTIRFQTRGSVWNI
jgi:hypothetical protein